MPTRPSTQHIRSLSTASKRSESPANRVSRAISTSALHTMAAVTNAPGLPKPSPRHTAYNDEDGSMSTIPDPRSRTMSPADGLPPSPSQHPDLSNEVAALSNKLINAINHQTNLDDTLSATRHELESSRERIKQLELEAKDHGDQIARGLLIRSNVVQAERKKLLASLNEEKRQREVVEKDKKHIDQELENLTQALFEEANKMVKSAREEANKDHEVIQRKNDQLKAQLADTENLLKSHQEQLAELKRVMEQMNEERDDQTNPTAPSTPGVSKFDSKEETAESSEGVQSLSIVDIPPSYPTSFTHLIHPVLRTDLASFDDFMSLLRTSKNLMQGNRGSSGSYAGIGIGLGLGAYSNHTPSSGTPSNGSTASVNTSTTVGSSPATPTTPASTTSTGSTNGTSGVMPLKETRFYKRALVEDIEPTLRLDTAPGLSWLARRTVLNAMCEGTLVVEPLPTSTAKLYIFACSLCGEARKDPSHIRTHRFRTSESDSAQRYPLCKYCLGRVRSSCDFLGFLRVLKDGHWRTDDEESERIAWEESVRLREQMFWCRIGGGVVPASSLHPSSQLQKPEKSPRLSEDAKLELETMQKLGKEADLTGEIRPRDVTPVEDVMKADGDGNETFLAQRRARKSAMSRNDTAEGLWDAAQDDAVVPAPVIIGGPTVGGAEDHHMEVKTTNRDSAQSLSSGSVGKADEKRLSITIPGAFD